jgi:hypothetical protein
MADVDETYRQQKEWDRREAEAGKAEATKENLQGAVRHRVGAGGGADQAAT